MKKVSIWIVIAVVLSAVCVLGFGYKKSTEPNYYYQVYLESSSLDLIVPKTSSSKYT